MESRGIALIDTSCKSYLGDLGWFSSQLDSDHVSVTDSEFNLEDEADEG